MVRRSRRHRAALAGLAGPHEVEPDMRAPIAMLFTLLLLAGRAGAQTVRGVAITPDSALVPGVIVTLLDSTGTPVARALADDGGEFTMRAPHPGTYRIEAKRLAFRRTLDNPIVLREAALLRHVLVLTDSPVLLPGVRVTAEAQCHANSDSASAAFGVWEEARKALRASQLTRLTRDYTVDVTTFVRRQSPGLHRWRTTDTTARPGMSLRPFVSMPAEQLAERGFMTRERGTETFHAPDEDVLLSESFAATHCLRMLPDSAPDVVRLGFSPTPGRRQADISGVLTIDRASFELRRLDFSFVNLPVFDVSGSPGGEIVFQRLPEGSWIIAQWAIWLPVAETRTDIAASSPQQPTRGAAQPRIVIPATTKFGLRTTGGHVNRVAFREETLWLRPAAVPAP